tara:strand:+ start:834 stop:1277 length:444 start_codon:yes stop_codon:yes gene_type:complete
MANRSVLDNGQIRNFGDMKIVILGAEFTGITAFSLEETQEKENVYTAGSLHPSARKRSTKNFSGSITMLHRQYEAMRQVSPNLSILDLPIASITSTFSRNGVIDTDVPWGEVVQGVDFTSISKSYEVDGDSVVELAYIAAAVIPIIL